MVFDPEPKLAGMGRWRRLGLAMLAGALMTAGHAPINLPWAMFLGAPLAVWLGLSALSPRSAAWAGWGVGFGYFLTGLHWIVHPFLVRGEVHDFVLWLAWLAGGLGALAAMAAGLALFWALPFWAARRFGPKGLIAQVAFLAALLSLAEYARANVLTGFPWALPAYVWVETPIAQMAAWTGPFGLTFLTLLLGALPLMALAGRRFVTAGLCLAVFAGAWVAGSARLPGTTAYAPDAPVLRIIQPNAPQHEKWVPGKREVFYQRALKATAAAPDPALGPADLVIWPETSAYFLPAYNPDEVTRIAKAAGGAPVIFGALDAVKKDGREVWHNSMFVAMPDGTLAFRYDKHHLVPFGEYLPFEGLLTSIGLRQLAIGGGFSPGPGPAAIHIEGLPVFAPLICYEAIFPNQIVAETRPDWLLQITNDAWFGSFAGPQQHLAQARFRAIEQGLPLVRAANTGISAVIDSYGLVVVSAPLHNYRAIDSKLPLKIEPTLYSRWGDALALFVIVTALVFCAFQRIISRSD